MSDSYPTFGSIPSEWLVSSKRQPHYIGDPAVKRQDRRANLPYLLVDRHVRAGRGHVSAFIHADTGERWTYSEVESRTRRSAAAMVALGVDAGDRIAIRSSNQPEVSMLYIAAWRLGAVAVLTPPQARRAEIPFFIDDTKAKVLFVANKDDFVSETLACISELKSLDAIVAFPESPGDPLLSWAELTKHAGADVVDRQPETDEIAVVWHTGGSTGTPKACYHTGYRLIESALPSISAYGVREGDIHLFPAPIGHAAGWLSRTTFSLLAGITLVELENFTSGEDVLNAITEYSVTWFMALGGVTWAAMLKAYERSPSAYDLSSLERTYAPFMAGSVDWLYEAWRRHGLELLNPMGSTAFATWFMVPRHTERNPPMTLGRPVEGFEVRIVTPYSDPMEDVESGEVGQLAIRGPSGLTYWNRHDLQERDIREGWTVIDDLARLDENGYYWYAGRADMLITTSGYKVAPTEVEQVISTHPAVGEVTVTAALDELRGEVVMAWIVPTDAGKVSADLANDIRQYVRDHVSPYKYPRRIAFVYDLPHDPVGKIIVKEVNSWARGENDPPVIVEF